MRNVLSLEKKPKMMYGVDSISISGGICATVLLHFYYVLICCATLRINLKEFKLSKI